MRRSVLGPTARPLDYVAQICVRVLGAFRVFAGCARSADMRPRPVGPIGLRGAASNIGGGRTVRTAGPLAHGSGGSMDEGSVRAQLLTRVDEITGRLTELADEVRTVTEHGPGRAATPNRSRPPGSRTARSARFVPANSLRSPCVPGGVHLHRHRVRGPDYDRLRRGILRAVHAQAGWVRDPTPDFFDNCSGVGPKVLLKGVPS